MVTSRPAFPLGPLGPHNSRRLSMPSRLTVTRRWEGIAKTIRFRALESEYRWQRTSGLCKDVMGQLRTKLTKGNYDDAWAWRIEIPLYLSAALAAAVLGWLMPGTSFRG